MAITNTILQIVVFKFKSLDGACHDTVPFLVPCEFNGLPYLECLLLSGEPETEKPESNESSLFKHVMKSRPTQAIAFFIAAHLGVGAALGGWIVTYIIKVRGGGPSSGYISAGVSGGSFTGSM